MMEFELVFSYSKERQVCFFLGGSCLSAKKSSNCMYFVSNFTLPKPSEGKVFSFHELVRDSFVVLIFKKSYDRKTDLIKQRCLL